MQQKVVKEDIWDHVEGAGFAYGPLLLLEQLQLLEKYLWPGYSEDASNYHVLLLALLVNVKRREGLPVWGVSSSIQHSNVTCEILTMRQIVSQTRQKTSLPSSGEFCP